MAVLEYVHDTVELARRQADRVVSPDSRQKAYDASCAFAQERPILTSFLAAQALFSLLPVLLFASFVLGTISLAVISALIFTLFWTGIAALVLGSTLFITSGLAFLAWVWVVAAYLAGNFVYELVFAAGNQGSSTPGKNEEQWRLDEKRKNIVKDELGAVVNGAEGGGAEEEMRPGSGALKAEL